MLQVNGIFFKALPRSRQPPSTPLHCRKIKLIGREIVFELGNKGFIIPLAAQPQIRILFFIGAAHKRASSTRLLLLFRIRLVLLLLLRFPCYWAALFIHPSFHVFLRIWARCRTPLGHFRVAHGDSSYLFLGLLEGRE